MEPDAEFDEPGRQRNGSAVGEVQQQVSQRVHASPPPRVRRTYDRPYQPSASFDGVALLFVEISERHEPVFDLLLVDRFDIVVRRFLLDAVEHVLQNERDVLRW